MRWEATRWDAFSPSDHMGQIFWVDSPPGYVAYCRVCKDQFAPRRTKAKAHRALLRHWVRLHND